MEDLGVEGRLLKWYRQVAGSCKEGNKVSGSIKCGQILSYLSNCQLLNEESAPWSYFVSMKPTLLPPRRLVLHGFEKS